MLLCVSDESLSQALVAYVGVPGRLDGVDPEERVVNALGASGLDLLTAVKAVVDEVYEAEPTPLVCRLARRDRAPRPVVVQGEPSRTDRRGSPGSDEPLHLRLEIALFADAVACAVWSTRRGHRIGV